MSLGVRYNIGTVNVGDTAELYAAVRVNEVPVGANDIASVSFTVQLPNDQTVGPVEGEVQEDGQGYYQWTETEEPGEYYAQAQFTLVTGEKRSVMVNFAVLDPFDVTPLTPMEIVVDEVWFRLEDCFDSIEGGPWLRDITLAHFDKLKIARFIPETLLDINVQMPPTTAVITDFTTPQANGEPNALLPILAKGVLCKTIMHLVRSYSEQPVPQGGQIVYEDRTRYKDNWMAVYKSEHEDYITMVRLWKRGFLHLGHSALLVSSKAGRLFPYGTMRSRNVGRGVGYY
jgi:hypothetical protein